MRFLIALAVSLTLSAGAALACSCIGYGSAAEHAANVDALFRGRVISSAPLPGHETTARITTFALAAPLKMPAQWGAPPETIDVIHGVDSAGCGMQFPRDRDVLVAANIGQDRKALADVVVAVTPLKEAWSALANAP